MVEKSYLVQRFARLGIGSIHIVGYSVAGEETVVQVPEMDVCFDIGRAPYFALTSNIVCITHGHMDHLAGLAYYLSQRHFQGMKAGTILLPRELEGPVDRLLRCWQDVERQQTPYRLVPLAPGDVYEVRRDFHIHALETHHGGGSLGYSLISVRDKLRPEYLPLTGPQIAELRKQGVEIQYRIEVPLVTCLGDTAAGRVFDHPDVVNAQVLLTECTFFDPTHRQRAKVGKHLHLEQFVEMLAKLQNEHIIVTHVTRRTSIRRAKHLLRKRIGEERMANIHFLMDLEGAAHAGEMDQAAPPPPDTAE